MKGSQDRRSDESLGEVVAGLVASGSHLERAVIATRLASAAETLARAEVIAAREDDGMTWEEIGAAFGVSRQTAHERFRTGPAGLHSRLFKTKTHQSPSSKTSTSAAEGGSTARAARKAAASRS